MTDNDEDEDDQKQMNMYINKHIFLGGCRYDHDGLPLVDLPMQLPPCHIQEPHFLNLVLIHLEFITQFIDTSCPILILPNIGPLIYKHVKVFSDQNNSGISYIICR